MGLPVELQCLLQSFFAQNALLEKNLQAVLAALLGLELREVNREVIDTNIALINKDISDLDFEIRRTIQQSDCSNIWVLCNTTSDSLTQLATMHSASEIAYLKLLLDVIFVKNNTRRAEVLAISRMDALNASRGLLQSSGSAKTVLDQLVSETWLQCSRNGFYTLTARCLAELQGYLKDTYNDPEEGTEALKICFACKEFVTQGYRCSDLDCSCRFHTRCFQTYFTGAVRLCPVCKTKNWHLKDVLDVGEKAARMPDTSDDTSQTQLLSDDEGE